MKKRLRLLAWFLTLTMLCELLPLGTFAQSDIGQNLAQAAVQSLDTQNSVDFAGGTGTPEDPYKISTPEQLDAIRNNLSASYVLSNDIDLSSYGNWTPIGSESEPFKGSINGCGFSIKNMTINSSELYRCGFIAYASNPTIKNVFFEDADIQFSYTSSEVVYVAVIVAHTYQGTFDTCNVSGTIRISSTAFSLSVGGIVGYLQESSQPSSVISNCVNYASVTVSDTSSPDSLRCGGIAGYSDAPINNCENHGNLHAVSDRGLLVGGIVGRGSGGNNALIALCKNYGTISAQTNVDSYSASYGATVDVAGIAGIGNVTNSVNSGSVSLSCPNTSGQYTAGIAGHLASVTSCYNLAESITSTGGYNAQPSTAAYRIGGDSNKIKNCYSLSSTLVNGAVPTDKLSPDSQNGESLSYDDIVFRVKEIFPDYEAPDRPEEPDISNVFTFDRDNLSFLNGGNYFFNDWELYYSQHYNRLTHQVLDYIDQKYADGKGDQYFYQISDEKFNQLIGKGTPHQFKPRVIKYLNNRRFIPWGGSCEGMSRIVMLHYIRPDLLPLDSITVSQNSTVYSLNAPKDDNSVENLTNYYFLMQYLPTAAHYLADTATDYRTDPSGSVEKICKDLRKGNPVFASIKGNGSGHAIVLLDITSETSDYYDIRVFDPNCPFALSLKLFKNTDGDFPKIEYCNTYTYNGKKVNGHTYDQLQMHILSEDINILDLRNYFGYSNNESKTDFDDAHVILNERLTDMEYYYGKVFVRNENGVLVYSDDVLQVPNTNSALEDFPSRTEFIFPSQPGEVFKMTLTPDGDNSVTSDILLKDTLFSISASGAVDLTYDEKNRTVDVKSVTNEPIQVNMSFTQNDISDDWPWHSWAIDTTGTTEFHAELKDDGLHLSGDGIANAKYATENADTDVVDSGTIPDKAENVTITKKADDDSKTEIKDNTEPIDPEKFTVTVVNGTITQINADVLDPAAASADAGENDLITITADDKTAEGKTFREWVVTAGNITLNDAASSTASFTMGAESVRIEAQYDSAPVDPEKLTVTVVNGTITQINADVLDPAAASADAGENDLITITADDKTAEGKTFREWAVTAGNITLDDAASSTASFTMGAESVRIEAQYDSTPVDPEKLTVTVVNGTITQINADVLDPAEASADASENDLITITADDKTAEGKTFREWVVTAGNITLDDAASSTASFTMGAESVRIEAQYDSAPVDPVPTPTPGGDSGSGGGGGGGAAVLLGVGAAAAITAGVIMTMPVDIQGRVELADHATVPGAKISLLHEGKVVTQTTADDSGNFSLKAKRGSYELTVVYTDANGQFVQKTTSIKAPAKDLVITF